MSARLNLNELKYVSWKGKVFYQLSSNLQATQDTNENTTGSILFKPRPIKHAYRREIVVSGGKGNPRISQNIDELTSPNGFLVYKEPNCNGLVGILDDTLPNNQTELGNTCTICNTINQCLSTSTSPDNACFSKQLDARRRVRSSGMIPSKFNANRNNDNRYFVDNKQYLTSRNRTIYQNSYNFIRQGDSTLNPGTASSKTNVYSPQGLSHCELTTISVSQHNNTFQYIWIDGATYTVIVPDGSYDIRSFNEAFKLIMIQNTHYYVSNSNLSKNFLLNFSYNTLYGRVEIQALSLSSYPLSQYTAGGGWSIVQNVPQFVFSSNALSTDLGVSPQTFPINNTFSSTQTLIAPNAGSLVPPYVKLTYKPSNPQFSNQGAVSSSNYISRKVYDSITNNGYAYRNTLGSAVANAMAYRVVIPGYNVYTQKDVLGYPNKNIPKIDGNGDFSKCTPKRFSNLY